MPPPHNNHKKALPPQRRGQNITEYLILIVGVLTVVILMVQPQGIFTQGVNKALNMMFKSVDDMATVECLGTLDDVDGGWSGYSSWTPCTACTQTQTRTCTSPSPKCGGTPCTLADGTKGLIETLSQSCSGSGLWLTGTCGVCTGACGETTGTCVRSVICDGGCCDSADEPSSTEACTKAPYPDVWSVLGFAGCSTTCGEGISSQTVTCSWMCCDPATKPPTRQACTQGCCDQSLDIGLDVDNNVQFTASFGPAANGQSYSVSCPSGYTGAPTSTCMATADPSCAGDDTYSPPASCYSIGWTPVSNTCVPADCPATAADAGYGRTWDVPASSHGDTLTLNCSDGPSSYTGTASYQCWLGAWQNLIAGCVPNCPAQTSDIGAGLSYPFPETPSGGSVSVSCVGYDEGQGCGPKRYEGAVSRSCFLGTWSDITGACGYKSCGTDSFMDPNALVLGTFTGPAEHGTPQTLTCSDIDSRYGGTFSRTCDYGLWCSPAGGCAAKDCSAWTPAINGVNVTFAATGHNTTQTGTWTDNTYTCDPAAAKCCFGQWFTTSTDCAAVTSVDGADAYSGTCRAFACQNDLYPSNATKCSQTGEDPADETSMTTDTNWSVVDSTGAGWECTSAKCEYNCNDGYVKSGNTCIAAVCTGGNPDPRGAALACPGDDPPLVTTSRTLKLACSSPAGSDPKCEYACPSGYVLYNGACCSPACPLGSCGAQSDGCGQTINCGNCCGNGAIDSGEQCDGGNLNGKSCSTQGYSAGTLACNSNCTFNTSSCCNPINGTWGPWGACSNCYQARTCNGASCGGSCSGNSTRSCYSGTWSTGSWGACSVSCGGGDQTRSVTCSSSCCDPGTKPRASQVCGTQVCCGNGVCAGGETCSTCPSDCGACSGIWRRYFVRECGYRDPFYRSCPSPLGSVCSPVGDICFAGRGGAHNWFCTYLRCQ